MKNHTPPPAIFFDGDGGIRAGWVQAAGWVKERSNSLALAQAARSRNNLAIVAVPKPAEFVTIVHP